LKEPGKGLIVIVAGFGLLSLMHHESRAVAKRFVEPCT